MVLLAVVSVLEGYGSLGTIGASAVVVGPAGSALFTLACLGVALRLTHPMPGEGRTVPERYLVRACMLLAAATLALLVDPHGPGSPAVGAADLLVALACLVAAGSGERQSVRQRRTTSHPSRLAPAGVAPHVVRAPTAGIPAARPRERMH